MREDEANVVVLVVDDKEEAPLDVPRLRKNATDVEILSVARRYCERK